MSIYSCSHQILFCLFSCAGIATIPLLHTRHTVVGPGHVIAVAALVVLVESHPTAVAEIDTGDDRKKHLFVNNFSYEG